jgi:uncharacterized protein
MPARGVAHTTVRGYLDRLSGALLLRQLQPWHENLGKRQVKSPKVYVADSGLLHGLLDIETADGLASHPKVGASWEGFVIEQILSRLRLRWDECWFWATHAGAELDLLVINENGRRGFEIKRTTAPKITSSMRSADPPRPRSARCHPRRCAQFFAGREHPRHLDGAAVDRHRCHRVKQACRR